jgi:ribosomal protein L11
MLGSRKETAELDKGGAGQDKLFWEDVALEFNSYSEEKKSYRVLVLTSAYDKKLFSEKMWTPP